MTTFAQAQELIGRLDAQSVGGITVKYTNWSKDLLWQRIADDAAADGKLGGSGGLKKLLAAAEDLGAQVFLDTDYTAVARFSGLSNAYNSAAKTISDTAATTGVYKIDTFYRDKNLPTQYLLSLGKMKTGGRQIPGGLQQAVYQSLHKPRTTRQCAVCRLYRYSRQPPDCSRRAGGGLPRISGRRQQR